MQLHITGFIRSDIVLQPGALDWGTVDLGSTVEKRLQVTYAGRDNWEILDVKTADPHFEVEIKGPGAPAERPLTSCSCDSPTMRPSATSRTN